MQLRTYPIMLGKNGMTKEFVSHVKKMLKEHKVVKIRVLESSGLTVSEAINKIGAGRLVKRIGKTFILSKK